MPWVTLHQWNLCQHHWLFFPITSTSITAWKNSLTDPFLPSANTCVPFPSPSVIPHLFKSTGGAGSPPLSGFLLSSLLPPPTPFLALLLCSSTPSFIQMPLTSPITHFFSTWDLSFLGCGNQEIWVQTLMEDRAFAVLLSLLPEATVEILSFKHFHFNKIYFLKCRWSWGNVILNVFFLRNPEMRIFTVSKLMFLFFFFSSKRDNLSFSAFFSLSLLQPLHYFFLLYWHQGQWYPDFRFTFPPAPTFFIPFLTFQTWNFCSWSKSDSQ